jgi:hypothetical protein
MTAREEEGRVADELRPDIAKAKSLMQTKLGSGREIKRLVDHLWDNETVDRMVGGRYGGGTGLLVLTDRRLIFLKDGMMRQTHEDFPLDKISSVQWSSGMALGKIQIFVSGNKAEIDNINKKDGKDLTEMVRNRISQGGSTGAAATAPPPAQPPTAPLSVADELTKLAQLRDAGLLSEDEFAAQRARLLGG